MKRKYNKKKKGSALQKKTVNPTLDSFFKISNDNKYRNTTSTKKNPSPALKILKSAGKKLCIVRNPSKTHITEDSQQVLKKYHEKAQNAILCDFKIIDNLYNKLESSFDKINRFMSNYKKYQNKNINKKELITKFLLQLKYIDIAYIPQILLSEVYDESKISQNLKNFLGYNDFKKLFTDFMPHNIRDCQIFWPNITEIITKYLNNFKEGKGLFIYVEDDYLSYLKKIKLLCNLYNYETSVIDESNQMKCMILDKLSEAMQTKRLPSISENLGIQILMLEEMVNSFSYKWEIFSKNINQDQDIKLKNNTDNIYLNKSNDLSDFNNNISSISMNTSLDISSNEKIKFTSKNLNIICEEMELKSKDSYSTENKNKVKNEDNYIDDTNKIDISTNETFLFKNKNNNNNSTNNIKNNDINYKLLTNKEKNKNKSKSTNKSREKSKNNLRNRSSEYKKRKNKKNENNINNANIKGYFKENTKEHKLFTQLQNNLFLYCTKAKTSIIIADSFSDKDIDKRYFNNILLKISQTKCPIIILTNNLEYLYISQQKRIKNLKINCILSSKNKRDENLIYFYYLIIYLNIKLTSLKFNKNIQTYEQLFDFINSIDTDSINFELCHKNLKSIYNLSEYLCYYGKFEIDVIDLRLAEMLLELENKINENEINSNDFNDIIEYLYNEFFPNKDNYFYDEDDDKCIEEIYTEYENKSFIDFSKGIKENLIDKIYKEKLNLNVSYKHYLNSKDSMVNMEGLILEKIFHNTDNFEILDKKNNKSNPILPKSYSFDETINNKIIIKLKKEDQLFLSFSNKIFIPISSLCNYVYPISRIWIIKKNKFNSFMTSFSNFFKYKNSEEQSIFIDIHVIKKIFHKIENNFFLNEKNVDYASNYILKQFINQKKINATFYE